MKHITIGCFNTSIDKYEDIKYPNYYQLSENTTPKSKLINWKKNFKTEAKAEEYYKKQLRKILTDSLKELEVQNGNTRKNN